MIFAGTYTPAKATKLAIFSDDGCRVTLNGQVVHDQYAQGQQLEDLGQSFHDIDVTLKKGTEYFITVEYTNTVYTGSTDVDGATLFVWGGGDVGLPSLCDAALCTSLPGDWQWHHRLMKGHQGLMALVKKHNELVNSNTKPANWNSEPLMNVHDARGGWWMTRDNHTDIHTQNIQYDDAISAWVAVWEAKGTNAPPPTVGQFQKLVDDLWADNQAGLRYVGNDWPAGRFGSKILPGGPASRSYVNQILPDPGRAPIPGAPFVKDPPRNRSLVKKDLCNGTICPGDNNSPKPPEDNDPEDGVQPTPL